MGLSIITTPQELWKFGTHERAARGTPLALWAEAVNGGVDQFFSTFRKSGTQAGYQVTAGKTLLITRLLGWSNVAVTYMGFSYTDDDLGLSALGPGTNPIYLDRSGASASGPVIFFSSGVMYDVSNYFEIAAGKYFNVQNNVVSSSLRLFAFGHEV